MNSRRHFVPRPSGDTWVGVTQDGQRVDVTPNGGLVLEDSGEEPRRGTIIHLTGSHETVAYDSPGAQFDDVGWEHDRASFSEEPPGPEPNRGNERVLTEMERSVSNHNRFLEAKARLCLEIAQRLLPKGPDTEVEDIAVELMRLPDETLNHIHRSGETKESLPSVPQALPKTRYQILTEDNGV